MLSDAAVANAQALGGLAPNFAEMQKTVTEAMQNTSRQVTAAVEEMRKRMTDLQTETQKTGQGVANQSPPARKIRWRALIRKCPQPRGGGRSDRSEVKNSPHGRS